MLVYLYNNYYIIIIMNVILSYPRSGNHLTRFFIELITEQPTYGYKFDKNDL